MAVGEIGVHHGDGQAVAAEAFAVFVGLVLLGVFLEASMHGGLMICWKRLMLYMVAVLMFLS